MTPTMSSRARQSAREAPAGRAARRAAEREGRVLRPGAQAGSRVAKAVWVVVAAAVCIAGGVLLYGRIAQVQRGAVLPDIPQGVQRDPATRARGAVISISGEASRPEASYDPASGTVTVRFQSRYYEPTHTVALNRQYLATEGRLVVQLALYNDSSAAQVVAELYHGRQHLATVTGAPGQDYAAYSVRYAPGLP
ncbi:MAG TPA: hypothetical protein VKW09_05230 [bacterium]|nr:hypothetical protein [bacterium]